MFFAHREPLSIYPGGYLSRIRCGRYFLFALDDAVGIARGRQPLLRRENSASTLHSCLAVVFHLGGRVVGGGVGQGVHVTTRIPGAVIVVMFVAMSPDGEGYVVTFVTRFAEIFALLQSCDPVFPRSQGSLVDQMAVIFRTPVCLATVTRSTFEINRHWRPGRRWLRLLLNIVFEAANAWL